MYTALPSFTWNNFSKTTYQSGETLTIFTNTLANKVKGKESDPIGIWTRNIMSIKKRKLVVYNTYRTNTKTLKTKGCDTPWIQQW